MALLLLLWGCEDWALVSGSALLCRYYNSWLVASCSLWSTWSPPSFHISFHFSSAFVFAKPSFYTHYFICFSCCSQLLLILSLQHIFSPADGLFPSCCLSLAERIMFWLFSGMKALEKTRQRVARNVATR